MDILCYYCFMHITNEISMRSSEPYSVRPQPVEEAAKAIDDDFEHHPILEDDEDTDQVDMIDATVQLGRRTLEQVSPTAPVNDTLGETQLGHGKGTEKAEKQQSQVLQRTTEDKKTQNIKQVEAKLDAFQQERYRGAVIRARSERFLSGSSPQNVL
ncbi:hypothetical protein HPB47_006417 [Ixodes persulcatus]|uniref:Uncharacterized protein n=1 Tax=Ixodes persulcatus TaxID=34615 RepID=A0AC60PBA8_IXOPE|nr:hypothetical protein HPB47_006417 [Ixodes persulcatus]